MIDSGKTSKFGSFKETFKVAGPVLVESLAASTVGMINTAMVGSLGRTATAIVGVNSSPMWVLNSIPMGLAVGSTVLIARSIGAGERKKANDVATQTLGGMLLLALMISATLFFASSYIPALVQADPNIWDDAGAYLRILSLSIVPQFLGLTCSAMLRGAGNTKTPMFAGLMVNVVTVCMNFMLIYEPLALDFLGLSFILPRAGLGVTGAAVSTAAAQVLFGIFMLFMVCSKKQKIPVSLSRIFAVKWDTIRPILKVGLPAMGERMTISVGQVLYQTTVNSLGELASAAHHIAVQVESIAFMPAFALSIASTTLVGQSLGAKNTVKAQGYANTTLFLGAAVGLLCSFLFFFMPTQLVGIFIDDPYVISYGASALRVIAPVEPFFCMLIVINGILRGGGDTAFAFLAGLAGMWGVRIGSAYAAVNLMGWGLTGAWIGMAADIMTRFIIMFLRYRRKKWLNTDEI